MQTEDTTHPRLRRPGPWTAVPSHIAKNRGYMNCSLTARHLYLIAWLYANRERTDGKLHMADFRSVAADSQLSERDALVAADELEQCGLWNGKLPGPGYELVDFLKWNLDAAEIKNRAADNLARVHAFRASKKGFPDPSKESEIQNSQNTQVRNQLRNALQDQDETEQAKEIRLAIAQLAKDKALELNGQGSQRMESVA